MEKWHEVKGQNLTRKCLLLIEKLWMSRLIFLYKLYFYHIFRFSISWTLNKPSPTASGCFHLLATLLVSGFSFWPWPPILRWTKGPLRDSKQTPSGDSRLFLPGISGSCLSMTGMGQCRSPRAGLYKGTETPPEMPCLIVTATPNCL